MSHYPMVERPFTINGCTLRNRVFRCAHGTLLSFLTGGVVNDQMIAYHLPRARAGVALSILDAGSVHPSSPGAIIAYREENDEGWHRMAEACHAEGMKVFQQLFHGGSPFGRWDPASGRPSLSPSGGASPGSPHPSRAMPKDLIHEVVAAHAAVALRCRNAGLDGVEVHAAHGYLLHEFLSPLTNRRTDEYGGSVENRARFLLEILRAVRSAVGPDFPVGIRISNSEWMPDGLAPEHVVKVVEMLQSENLVDFLDMSSGSYFNHHITCPGMHERPGYQLPLSEPIREVATVPILVSGRFTSLQQVEDVLNSGAGDMVSMVRALIADPELVSKSLAGREAEVRPCIGCSQDCLGGVEGSRHLFGCNVNPYAGSEYKAPPITPATEPKRVLVVGGGPSGMEAALTARLRGHEVVIHEAAEELGGNMRFARRAPFRADIGKIIDFQASELERLGAEIRLNSTVDLDAVRQSGIDHVIVATGAAPRRDGIQRYHQAPVPGAELGHVLSSVEALTFVPEPTTRAIVLDDIGTYQAIGAAEHLLMNGAHVTFITSFSSMAPELAESHVQAPNVERLRAYETFEFMPLQTITEITPTSIRLREIGNLRERQLEANLVVLCIPTAPRADLYHALEQAGISAQIVGDAASYMDLGKAIKSGHEAALAL